MEIVEAIWSWAKDDPWLAGFAALALITVLTWILNRESKAERDARETTERLVKEAKDRYRDVRPL